MKSLQKKLSKRETAKEGQIWRTLTDEQKREVYLSYEESQDDKKLISWETIKKKY